MWNVSVSVDTLEVECGFSFPLPGDVQTVPRAELYAIKTIVCGCYWGLLEVVSDRFTNVDMYDDPDKAHMTKSLSADLWKAINDHCNKWGVRL